MIISCEHAEGCKKEYSTLKDYFKHHYYYFTYCREDKKYLKEKIRENKSKCLKKK
jgi:hypothetical protein